MGTIASSTFFAHLPLGLALTRFPKAIVRANHTILELKEKMEQIAKEVFMFRILPPLDDNAILRDKAV